MPDIIIVILAVLFVLGVAINIHEFGHFIVAKMLGMRVEAYSFFGLGPRVWGFKKGNTDYRISAIPLGAFVKLYGDEATASLEGGESEGENVPESELYELRPRWQKFLVMIGGPFMNVLLALAIPFTMALIQGVPAIPAPIVGYVKTGGAAENAGIKKGDQIVKFDGVENPTWLRIQEDALLQNNRETDISVKRDGKRIDTTIVPSTVELKGQKIGSIDLAPDVGVEPVVIGQIQSDMPAASSGLKKGDRITEVNGKTVRNAQDAKSYIVDAGDNPIDVVVERGGKQLDFTTSTKKVDGENRIGIVFSNSYKGAYDKVGVAGAAAWAVNFNWSVLRLTGKAFGQMFSGSRSVKDAGISGPIGIVGAISQTVKDAGFIGLLPMLAMISLSLGVFNLLPIPLLDGGQIAVLAIESFLALFGMTLSLAVKEKIQLAGLGLILALMVLVMYLDISRIIGS
ncbi:MAG: RIP metalloprotease RseP [Pyrinomonadaceae bacterium]